MSVKIKNLEVLIPPEATAHLTPEIVNVIIRDLGNAAKVEWDRLASVTFHTAARDYRNGIQAVEFGNGRAVVKLVGAFPNMLEHGAPRIDLRRWLLGDNVPVAPFGQKGKRKSAKGHYYRAIPFRHQVPGSQGVAGIPMGQSYENHPAVKDAKILGDEVYAEAKGLQAVVSAPYEGVEYGEAAYEGQPRRMAEGFAPKLRPHHSTDIYAGMIRSQKTYEKSTQSQFITFRTISNSVLASKGNPKWIRRRTQGKNLSGKVKEYVSKLAPMTLEAYLEGSKK